MYASPAEIIYKVYCFYFFVCFQVRRISFADTVELAIVKIWQNYKFCKEQSVISATFGNNTRMFVTHRFETRTHVSVDFPQVSDIADCFSRQNIKKKSTGLLEKYCINVFHFYFNNNLELFFVQEHAGLMRSSARRTPWLTNRSTSRSM